MTFLIYWYILKVRFPLWFNSVLCGFSNSIFNLNYNGKVYINLNNYKRDLKSKKVKHFKGCWSRIRSLESWNVLIAEKICTLMQVQYVWFSSWQKISLVWLQHGQKKRKDVSYGFAFLMTMITGRESMWHNLQLSCHFWHIMQ